MSFCCWTSRGGKSPRLIFFFFSFSFLVVGLLPCMSAKCTSVDCSVSSTFFLLSYSSTNTFPLVNPNVELINRDLTSLCRRIISRERQCVPVTVINTSLLNNYLKLTGGLNRKHAFKIKQGFWMHTETILGLGGYLESKGSQMTPSLCLAQRTPPEGCLQ